MSEEMPENPETHITPQGAEKQPGQEQPSSQPVQGQSDGQPMSGPQMPQGAPMPPQGVPMPPYGPQMPPPGWQSMPPNGPMMPPPMARRPRNWQERFAMNYGGGMHAVGMKGERTVPGWLTGKSMLFFFASLFACLMAFGYVPHLDLLMISGLSVLLFFVGTQQMSRSWEKTSGKKFLWNVFWAAFVIRLLWALYLYFFFNPDHYGNTIGGFGDATWYMPFGQAIAEWISGDTNTSFSHLMDVWDSAADDVGYPVWLGIVYLLTGNISDVFVPLLIKCILGAYCAVIIYRIAKRHFGEGTARMAALFVCLEPNMVYWCGAMLKETEMVFLCCLSVDMFDRVLSSGNKLTFRALLPGVLAGVALFFFRTALALVIFMAVFAHVVMASRKVMSMGKKVIAGILVGAVLLLGAGDQLFEMSRHLTEDVQSGGQQKSMEWRAKREGGNAFAKYAGAAVFAPLIFTIPFPTYNQAQEGQLQQVQLSGGNYIKNVLSFFVILVLVLMLTTGEWRKHVFIGAYTIGYLVVLVMSAFAQSGRFHMPIMPMLMLFAAYGVQVAKGNKRLQRGYLLVLIGEVFVCLAWNWFKLAGRGLI